MTVEEALQFVDRVLASMQGSRKDHEIAQQAVETLRAAIPNDHVDSV